MGPESYTMFVEFIQNTGFPIFVAVYALVRLEKTVKHNTQVLTKIYEHVEVDQKKKVAN